MFKFLRMGIIMKPVTWLILFAFSIATSGCYYYKVTRSSDPPGETINKAREQYKYLLLHEWEYVWQLTDIILTEVMLTGRISPLSGHDIYKETKPDRANRYFKGRSNETEFLNEVHIYASAISDQEALTTVPGARKISLLTDEISKIEIYEKDTGATVASWVFSSLGIAAGAFGVLLLIVALTKSSCPFIYTWNGTDYVFSGEIFSGATQPGLERDDYLTLRKLMADQDNYNILITNEVNEIQIVNLSELICIDHPSGLTVIIDKYGKINTLSSPVSPISAVNRQGSNILAIIEKKDSLFYSGDKNGPEKDGIENIIMEFPLPVKSDSAKLVIKARNSFWLDVLFTKFHSFFGEDYEKFSKKQALQKGEVLRQNLLDQKMPLLVYIEKNGRWEFLDYFNIAGPMSMRDDVLPVSLEGISESVIRIKLETGFLFWELDYAALDLSQNEAVNATTVPVSDAVSFDSTDVKSMITGKDKEYLLLGKPGDGVSLKFNKPAYRGVDRTIVLHTSGYYKILRDQYGYADKKTLRTFRDPYRFPVFSKETYDKLSLKN